MVFRWLVDNFQWFPPAPQDASPGDGLRGPHPAAAGRGDLAGQELRHERPGVVGGQLLAGDPHEAHKERRPHRRAEGHGVDGLEPFGAREGAYDGRWMVCGGVWLEDHLKAVVSIGF